MGEDDHIANGHHGELAGLEFFSTLGHVFAFLEAALRAAEDYQLVKLKNITPGKCFWREYFGLQSQLSIESTALRMLLWQELWNLGLL